MQAKQMLTLAEARIELWLNTPKPDAWTRSEEIRRTLPTQLEIIRKAIAYDGDYCFDMCDCHGMIYYYAVELAREIIGLKHE
jgi:hypothetical protein